MVCWREPRDTSAPFTQARRFRRQKQVQGALNHANAGCDTLWSEDMQHSLVLDQRLRIANPFRPDAVF